MQRSSLNAALLMGVMWLSGIIAAQSNELKTHLDTFDRLELKRDHDAMRTWVRSEEGNEALKLFLKHYPELKVGRQEELSMELARLGVKEVLPIVKASFDHQTSRDLVAALPGIFYALNFEKPEPEFLKELAPLIADLLEDGSARERKYALSFLPRMDLELANKLLADAAKLRNDREISTVLDAYYSARAKHPLPFVEVALAKGGVWKSGNPDRRSTLEHLYGQALAALARHDKSRAITLAEEAIQNGFQDLGNLADIHLVAEDLEELFLRVLETPSNQFSELPKPARIFFAVTIFNQELMTGGLDKALWNSQGNYLAEVREGYRAMGATADLKYIEAGIALFGEDSPSPDQAKRRVQMTNLEFNLDEKLGELSSPNEDEKEAYVSPEFLIAKYAVKHAKELRDWLKGS